jgi:predicted nucleotidyltransferase
MTGQTTAAATIGAGMAAFFAQAGAGIVSAYLFGSRARGEQHRESDVDIAVLVDRQRHRSPRARHELRIHVAGALIHVLGTNLIDLVVLNDAPPLLARHIVTQGVRVFCSDPESDRIFARDAMLRAADLAPFLARTARRKLESLRP